MMNILFVSLGCDKNLVDSEVMLGLLAEKGYGFTDDEMEADVIVVNTCCLLVMLRKRVLTQSWRWQSIGKQENVRH